MRDDAWFDDARQCWRRYRSVGEVIEFLNKFNLSDIVSVYSGESSEISVDNVMGEAVGNLSMEVDLDLEK